MQIRVGDFSYSGTFRNLKKSLEVLRSSSIFADISEIESETDGPEGAQSESIMGFTPNLSVPPVGFGVGLYQLPGDDDDRGRTHR